MRFLSRAVSVEAGGNLRKSTILRFVAAAFVIGAAIVVRQTAVGGRSSATILSSALLAAGFFAAGVLAGRLSDRTGRLEEELASKDRELTRVKLHTDSIITNVSSGLIVTNTAGEIMTCNPAAVKILGLLPERRDQGKARQDVIPHMSALVEELEKALATGTPRRRHEIEIRSRDGAALPLGISLSMLKGENGEKRGVVAIFQDLTEVHRMREKVRRADKMAAIGELSTAIAHEIRAPLASICGSIEMLSGGARAERGQPEAHGARHQGIGPPRQDHHRFSRIRAAQAARVRAGRRRAVPRRSAPPLQAFERSQPERVVRRGRATRREACIYADDEQIRQVYLNLIMNACEAMSDGGRFTIRIGTDMRPLRENASAEECVVDGVRE